MDLGTISSGSSPPSPTKASSSPQPEGPSNGLPTPSEQTPKATPPPPSASFNSYIPPFSFDNSFTQSSPPSPPQSPLLPPVFLPAPNLPPAVFNPPRPNLSPQGPGSIPPPFPSSPPHHSKGSTTASGSSNQPPGSAGNGNGKESSLESIIAGGVLAGMIVIAFLALVFYVRLRKKKRAARYNEQLYTPPPHFSVCSDGDLYGKNEGKINSRQASSQYCSPMRNSSGSRKHGGNPDSPVIDSSKTFFSYEELMVLTDGFSRLKMIGEGGFGCVYKGLLADGKAVAVKHLKAGGGQGDREFKAEVEIISRVHHRHLVSLVGYCISENHRLLIYDFVPNKTLDHHLHRKDTLALDWSKRLKIAIGSAKGLAYLHDDCNPRIIHRDIKSSNILLDDDFEAQVADFGLARLNDTTQTHVSTRVMGTFGYMAPEYASSGKLTDRSDVFSFGVVLLELITGRQPVDTSQPLGDESLVEWARPLLIHALETGDIGELVDPRLEKRYIESEVLRMIETAASCVRHSAPKRPRMVQVVRALDREGGMSDLSNGVKIGQSTVYESRQYSEDIRRFRRMTRGSDEFSGSTKSEDYPSYEYSSRESESRAFNSDRSR